MGSVSEEDFIKCRFCDYRVKKKRKDGADASYMGTLREHVRYEHKNEFKKIRKFLRHQDEVSSWAV